MNVYQKMTVLITSVVAASTLRRAASAQVPDANVAPGETVVATLLFGGGASPARRRDRADRTSAGTGTCHTDHGDHLDRCDLGYAFAATRRLATGFLNVTAKGMPWVPAKWDGGLFL